MTTPAPWPPLLTEAQNHPHPQQTALSDWTGAYTYAHLLAQATTAAGQLLAGAEDLAGARVAFLTPREVSYVYTQWGIWAAGGIAVPLCEIHPPAEWAYVLDDAQASHVVAHPMFAAHLRPLAESRGLRFLTTTDLRRPLDRPPTLPAIEPHRPAMMLYTSGTTGRPKGVVSTHHNIQAQITSLIQAWGWQADDQILLVLPLHHTHGIINVLSCALWAGAQCHLLPKFEAESVWETFCERDLSLFMAVPTIYHRLIEAWTAAPPETQRRWSQACAKFRLMVSGSAALPVPTLEKWQSISGHTLLERYGMTEIGMALSNPLHGERRPGSVGQPLPGVSVRVVDEDKDKDKEGQILPSGSMGELQVQGEAVFKEYWRRPEETASAFTTDGWFRTGDIVEEIVAEDKRWFRILGRNSVDIIKTGGYKVSALEIEDALRAHPAIADCAVIGLPDPTWGERVAVAVIPASASEQLSLPALRAWAKTRLAPYKIPSRLISLTELPRNALGKVTKPALQTYFSGEEINPSSILNDVILNEAKRSEES